MSSGNWPKNTIMPKSLLIIALVAMQLLSWSGNSLYLCLCGNSACVDFGPTSCHCCAAPCDASRDFCRHNTCTSPHEFDDEVASVAQRDDCHCTHLQISTAIVATVVDSSSARLWHGNHNCTVVPMASIAAHINPRASIELEVLSECGGSTALTMLSSVVLRC